MEPAQRSGLLGRFAGLVAGRGKVVDLRFEEVARRSGAFGVQEPRSIGAELEPGRYLMRVTVRTPRTAAEATASAPLIVNDRER